MRWFEKRSGRDPPERARVKMPCSEMASRERDTTREARFDEREPLDGNEYTADMISDAKRFTKHENSNWTKMVISSSAFKSSPSTYKHVHDRLCQQLSHLILLMEI